MLLLWLPNSWHMDRGVRINITVPDPIMLSNLFGLHGIKGARFD